MSESLSLLKSSSTKRRCSFYCLLLIHTKGAVLVLVWDFIIAIAQYYVMGAAWSDNSFYTTARKVEVGLAFTLIASGYVGDFLMSRHRLVMAGLYSSFILLIFLILMVSLQLMATGYSLVVFKVIYYTVYIIIGAVRVNLLPFNIDQLIGSSSDELTAIIHWHNLGPLVAHFLVTNTKNPVMQHVLWLGNIIGCVTAVLVSHGLFNRYLETTPVNTVNPVKLIVRVLCYARKHKYPENRSALTYWEEEAPSRLDLGKDKYGGPFTEEEVEDVKTAFRLLPFVFIFGLSGGLYGLFAESMNAKLYGCSDGGRGQDVVALAYVILLIVVMIIFRVPYCRKYIPSMLKRIGMGLALIVLANTLYAGLAIIGNYQFGKMFDCLTRFDIISSGKWVYFDDIIQALVWYMNNVITIEFLLAQCPKSMRGTMIGLWLCLRILRSDLEFIIFVPFLQYMGPDFPLGRGFYFLLTLAILSFLVLLLFIFLAKRYKLRVREMEIPISRIAEDHIIRYIEQDEQHRINYSFSSSDNEVYEDV